MRYDLDDMYGMLNEYKEQDEKHIIQKQKKQVMIKIQF